MSRKVTLIVGLSSAPHLLDEIDTNNYIYAGPRFESSFHFIKTSSQPKLSSLIDICFKRGLLVDQIIIFCDIYSLSQFQPVIDINHSSIIAVIGDTHHGPSPLLPLINWLKKVGIAKVALKQTAHHKPIFQSYGFDVCILPYYAHNNKLIQPSSEYIQRVCFVGSTSSLHYKRTQLLDYLINKKVPIDIFPAPRDQTFSFYNRYCISLNVPLNYDYNYRINEVMSAGGCLLTAKLPAGISSHMYAVNLFNSYFFDSHESCYRSICILLENPNMRNYIAKNAYSTFSKLSSASFNFKLLTRFASLPSKNHLVYDTDLDDSLLRFEEIQTNLRFSSLRYTSIAHHDLPSAWRNIFA